MHSQHQLDSPDTVVMSAVPTVDPAAFLRPLPIPQTLRPVLSTDTTDYYDLDIVESIAELLPRRDTAVRTYGGSFIGPTIEATRGRRVIVRQLNRTAIPMSTHLHGGSVPSVYDGQPMDLIDPGRTKEYIYPNEQDAATLWYHDHAHHVEAENIFRGLAGFYLLRDPAEDRLNLPSGKYDVPIMLRDARFDENGQLVFITDDFRNRDTILVNGRPKPYLHVEARKYRFRFLNAANVREFRLCLSTSDKMIQIAGDQGLLPRRFDTETLELWPAERGEVVIDFSRYRPGTRVTLENELGTSDKDTLLLRFIVGERTHDPSDVPVILGEDPALPLSKTHRVFNLGPSNLDKEEMPINGKLFDHNRVDTVIPWGTTETWDIHNLDNNPELPVPHNFHTHLVRFRVLTRNGEPPTPDEAGWKDTVRVPPGETVRIQATFNTYTGRYVYHCHFIDHAAMGMMAQLEVVPSSPEHKLPAVGQADVIHPHDGSRSGVQG